MAEPEIFAVEMKAVTKRFARVLANDAVSLSVRSGEIHALIGENGAGKSTLMKILYGLYHPDSGEIILKGKSVRFHGPREAIRAGIGMVHQHFMLVPTLTVAENVALADEPVKLGGMVFDRDRAEEGVTKLSAQYGLSLDPRAKVADLSVGEQQRLEILKVLYRGAEILILDEPTAVLTPQETTAFFEILKILQSQGKTVILITHKLREVMAVSQGITVMRQGKSVGSVKTKDTSESELAQMMVGRPVLFQVKRTVRKPDEIAQMPVALKLENVTAKSARGLPALQGLSLDIRAGEIFGLAGVEGNGQTELIEVIAGLLRPDAGQVEFCGTQIKLDSVTADEMLTRGLGHIPEDRHKRGMVLDYAVHENMVLGRHREPQFSNVFKMNFAGIRAFAGGLVQDYDVRPPDIELKARYFSGGNQQKVVVGRELSRKPKLLIAAQPTRGVDVGAIELIHKKIIDARDSGAAVLLVSAELPEILSLSDRVGVIYRGKIAAVFPVGDVTEEKLGLLMAGAHG